MSGVPDVIRIEPASACNLHCIHCPTGTNQSKDRGIMSNETFNIIMRNFEGNVPRVAVMYHGGEPLLCKDLWDWVGRLKGIGVKYIKTDTNGMLLNEGIAEKIMRSGIDSVTFSIDGRTPEENDFIRRGSDCHTVMGNVQRLIELKRRLNSDVPSIIISNTQLRKDVNLDEISTPSFLLEAFKDSVHYQSMYAIKWAGQKSNNPPAYSLKGNYCPFLSETMTIRWNGDVVPCCIDIMSGYVMGNIHKSSLGDIREGESFKRIRGGIQRGHPVEFCKGCFGK